MEGFKRNGHKAKYNMATCYLTRQLGIIEHLLAVFTDNLGRIKPEFAGSYYDPKYQQLSFSFNLNN